jgi:hypothetical protein
VKTVSEFGIKGISLGEWIMIIITSLAFGLAHYIFGWGLGKITTATLDGFVFGLAYLFYGVQAPILLHWFFNYYWGGFSLALELYPNSLSVIFLIEIATLIVGLLGWSMFAGLLGVQVYRRLKNRFLLCLRPHNFRRQHLHLQQLDFAVGVVECCLRICSSIRTVEKLSKKKLNSYLSKFL